MLNFVLALRLHTSARRREHNLENVGPYKALDWPETGRLGGECGPLAPLE